MGRRFLRSGVTVSTSIGFVLFTAVLFASADVRNTIGQLGTIPPRPTGFAPSNSRTVDGNLIPVEQFFPASRCARCHQDTHAAWSESLHRNAAREPFYRESADILLRTRGIEFTRHCESCHTPVALFAGLLDSKAPRQTAPFTDMDDEGVTCSVCHSIVEARLDGTGSYTIRRPALLAKEDGTPIYGDISDEDILANIPAHKRAVMRPLLRSPEFCSTCHKVDAPPSLNGYKHIRGFSAYDEWQQSGMSMEAATPFYRRDQRVDCRSCHMPKVDSRNDRAAKRGVIASHRWLGANTAAPLFYGQHEQVKKTIEFLQEDLVSVDIFTLKNETTGKQIAQLQSKAVNNLPAQPGEAVTAEVVVSSRGIGHSFAPEVRDLYEIWVEFKVTNGDGEIVYHSGFIKPDLFLDESAHTYKAILLDAESRPITRHQIWLTAAVSHNTALPAGRSDIARFSFRMPERADEQSTTLKLEARVQYRRLTQEYTNYVLAQRGASLIMPIVQMAETQREFAPQANAGPTLAMSEPDMEARRWNDYGIGLMEQAQYGPASEAFRKAHEIEPNNPDYLISASVAELRTERYGPERNQLRKAMELIEAALKLNPTLPRARFYHAIILRGQGKHKEAAAKLAPLAREFPRDRLVQRELGATLYALGRMEGALAAFEAVISIDPTDFAAYQYLAPLYASAGRPADAERAGALFQQWRDDPLAARIGTRFFALNPQWNDERIPMHTHGVSSKARPVLIGKQAAPVE
ncbi:MAG TPA: multiheme c-type cytochrome [Pyrinomonadaceae bacterium]|nr:multiheme c-type cytochrome [Pyrinomonadaceae bacterium]